MELLSPGPAPRRKALRKGKKRSTQQELEVNELFGARMQPGSGNQAGAKGDGRKKGELRLEMKFTADNSFSLKLEELWKIAGEAAHGELAVFVVDFLEQGTRKLRDRFAVVHANDLKELLDAARNHR
jgi:hypothetical protein